MEGLEETPVPWCPGCEPDLDPFTTITYTAWCLAHEPSRAGLDDLHLVDQVYIGCAEVEGEGNRAWCNLLHRGRRPRRAPR